jgi:hypothetical protein
VLHRSLAIVCLVWLAVLAPGCELPELPTSPSPLSDGVVLFEHANFLGNSAHITGDVPDLRSFTGPCVHDDGEGGVTRDWNDCVSSVQVAPGWRVTIYKDTGYRDDSLSITAEEPNLALVIGDCDHDGLNDCVSSLRVRRD